MTTKTTLHPTHESDRKLSYIHDKGLHLASEVMCFQLSPFVITGVDITIMALSKLAWVIDGDNAPMPQPTCIQLDISPSWQDGRTALESGNVIWMAWPET